MKRRYETPTAAIQAFEANEYVAACFQLACNVRGSDSDPTYNWDGSENNTHGADGCGNAANQYITDNDGVITVRELSKDQGWLNCDIISPENGVIGVGTYVVWNTKSADGRTWHHYGTASASDPQHPNRS